MPLQVPKPPQQQALVPVCPPQPRSLINPTKDAAPTLRKDKIGESRRRLDARGAFARVVFNSHSRRHETQTRWSEEQADDCCISGEGAGRHGTTCRSPMCNIFDHGLEGIPPGARFDMGGAEPVARGTMQHSRGAMIVPKGFTCKVISCCSRARVSPCPAPSDTG